MRAELFGPQNGERVEDLRADFVLPAVAAGGRREDRPHALAAVQHHVQRVVLVVGMRGGLHEHAGVGQMPQHQTERDRRRPRDRRDARASARAGNSDRAERATAAASHRVARFKVIMEPRSIGRPMTS